MLTLEKDGNIFSLSYVDKNDPWLGLVLDSYFYISIIIVQIDLLLLHTSQPF